MEIFQTHAHFTECAYYFPCDEIQCKKYQVREELRDSSKSLNRCNR